MNILDYLATEFTTFEEKPFNSIDSAILSQFCMVRMEGIVPGLEEREHFLESGMVVGDISTHDVPMAHFIDALKAELYENMFTGLVPGKVKENLIALAASPRFREVIIHDYLNIFDTERQTQFAAMTFSYKDVFSYVGFRGTDASLTGWKENFNMAYTTPVPAQAQAVRYLETVAPRTNAHLYVGGHSKGGNLAMYAAMYAKPAVQEAIERIYDHDGPGFKAGSVTAQDYAAIRDRVHKTVPQESVIGMLMDSPADEDLRVVHSSDNGIMQHSIFTWDIDDGEFVYEEKLADSALFTDAVLTQWLAGYSDDQLAEVVEALFQALEASGTKDVMELFSGGAKTIALLGEVSKSVDESARDILLGALGSLTDITAHLATQGVASRILGKPVLIEALRDKMQLPPKPQA